jgi:hypothetical protein
MKNNSMRKKFAVGTKNFHNVINRIGCISTLVAKLVLPLLFAAQESISKVPS